MKRLTVFALVVVMFLVMVWSCLLNAPKLSPGSVTFILTSASSLTNSHQTVSIVLSNASRFNLLFPAGFGKPWLRVAYLTNGTWAESVVRTPGGGEQLLRPGESIHTEVGVPAEAEATKVAIPITSLTWRGTFSLWLFTHHNLYILGPIGTFFLHQDQRARSIDEWSTVLPLLSKTSTNRGIETWHSMVP